jgi:hypothetical protein
LWIGRYNWKLVTVKGYIGDDDGMDASALPKDYVSFAFAFTLQTGSLALMVPEKVCLRLSCLYIVDLKIL